MSGYHHQMDLVADDGDGLLFRCPEEACGRTVIIKRSGDLEVVERGDFFASHRGAKGSVDVDVSP